MKQSIIIVVLSVIFAFMVTAVVVNAQASLPPFTPYTQDFDTLANTGSSSVVPTGWTFSESGTNANSTYTAGNGSNNAGDTYSYGNTGTTDRAFGELQSGALSPTIGANFINNTGREIGRLIISYRCEQWRLGANTGRIDRMIFQFSTNATSLTTGTWLDVNSLDCLSSITTGSVGRLDGNTVTATMSVSDTITGLSIPNGSNFWIRWVDYDASGSDDGLAVDDFSMRLFSPNAVTLLTLSADSKVSADVSLPLALVGIGTVVGMLILRRRSRTA